MNLPNNRHADPCKLCGAEPYRYTLSASLRSEVGRAPSTSHIIECSACAVSTGVGVMVTGNTLDEALARWNGPWDDALKLAGIKP